MLISSQGFFGQQNWRRSGVDVASRATGLLLLWLLVVLTPPVQGIASRSSVVEIVSSESTSDGDSIYRLPTTVKPKHYDLTLEHFLSDSTFRGKVGIQLEFLYQTQEIVLHAQDLNVTSAVVQSETWIQWPSWEANPETQTIHFKLPYVVSGDTYATLQIDYIGPLRTDLSGFFVSPFTRGDGTNGTIMATHLQPTYARRAFPCFDEPALKATFSVTIISAQDENCISNTPIETIQPFLKSDGLSRVATRFQRTPRMSTYLVAWGVGDLSYTENTDTRIPIRVYMSPADNTALAKYAAEILAQGLEWYEAAFEIEYPLPKLDLLCLPTYISGALENWGLIIIHSSFCTYDPSSDGADSKETAAEILLHELGHQWFGNLVTLAWWDQTWLNEGVTSSVTLYCLQQLEPTWQMAQYKAFSTLKGAFGIDSYRTSHPIEIPINKHEDILQAFDQVSYTKGALALNMIREYMGANAFFKAIGKYLSFRSYANAHTEDVWAALTSVSGEDTASLMDPWSKKTGYPYIRITENGNRLEIEQHRFLTTGDATEEEDTLWPIFLSVRTRDGFHREILRDRQTILILRDLENDFYFLNANHSNLYRTLYTHDRVQKLLAPEQLNMLNPQEVAGLISDTCALAQAGQYKVSVCLDVIQACTYEDSAVVWMEIVQQLDIIRHAWMDDPVVLQALQRRTLKWAASVSHRLGWDALPSDDHDTQHLKIIVFREAGINGDQRILVWVKDVFQRLISGDEKAVRESVLPDVLKIALLYGGVAEYEAILRLSKTSSSASHRRAARGSLLVTEDRYLIKRTLSLLSCGEIAPADIMSVVVASGFTKASRDILWEWLRDDWSHIREWLPDSLGILTSLPEAVTGKLSNKKQLEELKKFIETQNAKEIEAELKLSYERTRAVVNWTERDNEDFVRWLGLDKGDEL